MQVVVAVEVEIVEEGQRPVDVARLGDGDGAIQRHDRELVIRASSP